MNDQVWIQRILMVVLPVLVLAFYMTASGHFGYTPDDTFIYLQYAKNIVHGNGIAFNAGEPTYGFTSPLWLLLIALGGSMGIDLATAAKAMDLVIASGAVIVFYLAAFELIRDMIVAMLATLAFSLHVWLLRWAGSGMETSLSVLLVLAAFLFCLRNEYLLAAIAAALLALVRPEGALFALFVAADVFINAHDRRFASGLVAKLSAVYAAILAPWLIYASATFGTVIPNTALAKSRAGLTLAGLGTGMWNIGSIVAASDGVALAGVIAGGIILWRKLRFEDAGERLYHMRYAFLGIGWVVSLAALYLSRNVTVVSRYMLLATPVLGILGFAFVHAAIMKSRFRRFAYAALFIFAGLSVLQSQIVYRAVVKPGIEAFESGMNSSLVSIGHWLNENTRPDETVLCWDIGAIGYYSERKVCDAAGLVTPGMIPYVRDGVDLKEMTERRLYEPYCSVNYIVHRSEEPNALKGNSALSALFTRPFYRIGLLKMRQDYYTLYHVTGADVQLKETP